MPHLYYFSTFLQRTYLLIIPIDFLLNVLNRLQIGIGTSQHQTTNDILNPGSTPSPTHDWAHSALALFRCLSWQMFPRRWRTHVPPSPQRQFRVATGGCPEVPVTRRSGTVTARAGRGEGRGGCGRRGSLEDVGPPPRPQRSRSRGHSRWKVRDTKWWDVCWKWFSRSLARFNGGTV